MVTEKMREIYDAQSRVWNFLSKIAGSSRIGSSYLFSGPEGCGKEAFAIKFFQLLNCEKKNEKPCNNCPSCRRALKLQHEKLNLIFPLPTPKKSTKDNSISFDSKTSDIIQEEISAKAKNLFHKIKIPKSNRILIQSIRNLRKSLYLKSNQNGRKIVLIFDAHLLSAGQGESANALLKLLEEPPNQTTLILVTDNSSLLSLTIKSRCQEVSFPKLDGSFIINWLKDKEIKESHIPLIAGLSGGNIYQTKFLISQSLDKLLLELSELVKNVSSKKPHAWREFSQMYSKMAIQDYKLFLFHFFMLKTWFNSLNRLRKNLNHVLHKTPLKLGMERLIKKFPNADYSSIVFEIEKTTLSVSQHFHMPLELTNLLIKIKRNLNK